jgi:hypothetical protein
MNLIDAIVNINPDENWGIWAEYPFVENSHSRYGKREFENGGLLDDLKYFSNSLDIKRHFDQETEGMTDDDLADFVDWMVYESAEKYIDIIMSEFDNNEENL